MLICQATSDFSCANTDNSLDVDWSLAAQAYPKLMELPFFISEQRKLFAPGAFETTADPTRLQGKQLEAYNIVKHHLEAKEKQPSLKMVVSGTAGTGKSYLIHCLRLLLKDYLRVSAPTGSASYNVVGHTIHSLLTLTIKGDFKDLEGQSLRTIQQDLANMRYIIIDEMSMVGRKMFGQVDRRLRQAFPNSSDEVFGGCSFILCGDFGQLPPVMDLPLYTTVSRSSELSDLGSADYQLFDKAVVLDKVMRQAGEDASQELFRNILLRLRDGNVTVGDWEHLMTRTPAKVADSAAFNMALHLYPTVEAAAEYNISKLCANGQPVATINAVHTGRNAAKASTDDAGGLEPVVCLAHGARVMLTANLWVDVGLVNGAMGRVEAICYKSGQHPPELPVAITVRFDSYKGPTLPDGTVPIAPLRRTWFSSSVSCSRLQLPLKLSWAVTIHKAQGMTLDKVVIDVGRKEFSSGLTFVACSRVRRLTDLLSSPPFPYQRLANLGKSLRLQEKLSEDTRLLNMSEGYHPAPQQEKCMGKSSLPTSGDLPLTIDEQLTPKIDIPNENGANLPPVGCDANDESSPDLEIIESMSTVPGVSPFRYNPVSEVWRRFTCDALGLEYVGPNGVTPGGQHVPLTRPCRILNVQSDGNCLFRALSQFITGSEAQHMNVRLSIVTHMRTMGHLLFQEGHLAQSEYSGGIEDYIASTTMEQSTVWGTDVEIFTFAHLLQIDIQSYSQLNTTWQRYSPTLRIEDTINMMPGEDSNMALYIKHIPSHFQVVQSVL